MIEQFQLINTTTNVSIDFNMIFGPIWLESIIIGPVEGVDQLYSIPGQDGEQVLSTYFNTRSVTITAWIVNNITSIEQQKRQLNKFCNPKQPIDIIVDSYKLAFIPGSSIQYSKNKKENNEVMCKFVIMGEAYFPFWTSQAEIESLISYVDPLWKFPFCIPNDGMVFSVNQPTASTQIVNESIPVGCRITFVSNGGILSNPGIICSETQEQISINKSLSDGEKIIIDTRIGHRKITGYTDKELTYNAMQYLNKNSSWITLQPGPNTFSFFASSGIEFAEISIAYSPLLLEVEN